ncbi:MAG: RsmB/NOP family class I SAM-dependent RNA methyltransferase, partial [Pseudomonadota bacterium]
MTPGGRIAAAIEILDAIIAPPPGQGALADHALRDWGRRHRFAGAGDRRAIADLVYDGLRRRRSLGWRLGESGRGVMLALAAECGALEPFSGEGHAPPRPTDDERAALARAGPPDAAVALDCPAWLETRLRADLGAAFVPVMLALQHRAPLHLRVNRLKADRTSAIHALAQDHITAVPLAEDPDALAVDDGARLLRRSAAFASGLVEIQDLSSQRVARLARAAPGETLLDYCAGGGGKALALAAHQGGAYQGGAARGEAGRIFAHDAAPARMGDLPKRAERAGARIVLCPPAALPQSCDCV